MTDWRSIEASRRERPLSAANLAARERFNWRHWWEVQKMRGQWRSWQDGLDAHLDPSWMEPQPKPIRFAWGAWLVIALGVGLLVFIAVTGWRP